MIDDLMKIGDKVTILNPPADRTDGYEPCPNGTKATILCFSEITYGRLGNFGFKPGVYEQRGLSKVQLENGHELWLNTGRLYLIDNAEYNRRLASYRKHQLEDPENWLNAKFIRDLPETPFWEGDFVRVHDHSGCAALIGEMSSGRGPDVFQVIRINYEHLTGKTMTGTVYPAYQIATTLNAAWSTSASEDKIELVERGLVWKYYHNEPIVFGNIKEEAKFFELLGHTREIKNPANGMYVWTLEEVLAAIQSGIVHCFSMGSSSVHETEIRAKRFVDDELGRRVATATLEGFGCATA